MDLSEQSISQQEKGNKLLHLYERYQQIYDDINDAYEVIDKNINSDPENVIIWQEMEEINDNTRDILTQRLKKIENILSNKDDEEQNWFEDFNKPIKYYKLDENGELVPAEF